MVTLGENGNKQRLSVHLNILVLTDRRGSARALPNLLTELRAVHKVSWRTPERLSVNDAP